jgi:chemotaxis protein MotD
MDFAEQLASAARPAATVANAPVATRRAPGLQADAVAPLDSTDPNAGEPAGVTASAPAAPAAKPLLEPKQAQAAPAQGAPVHVDVGAMPPRHSPSPSADRRADEASAARAAFRDVVAEQPGASGKRDGSVPERLREVQAVVTRQETVLAPAGQMPVAHQAADRIIAELQSSDDAAPADRAQTSRPGEAPAPVRTLHIQLQPADMGMLTVKLSMRAEMLDIKLEAAEHRTARLLEADRERLTDILRSAGYALDGVTVQISSSEKPVQTFNAMAGQGGNGQPQQGAQSGGAQADAQRGQGSQRGNDDGSVAAGNDGGDHGPRVGSADGDLYL